MKLMPRLVTAFALANDVCASGLARKARAKPVTAYAGRWCQKVEVVEKASGFIGSALRTEIKRHKGNFGAGCRYGFWLRVYDENTA
jgi:hypothetical protein